MTELLPPNPDESGWHLLLDEDGQEIAWHWQAEGKRWDGLSPADAAFLGYRYLRPIPSADRLAAMEEIVAAAATRLAEVEKTEGAVPDDCPVGFGGHAFVAADLIRRATGEKA